MNIFGFPQEDAESSFPERAGAGPHLRLSAGDEAPHFAPDSSGYRSAWTHWGETVLASTPDFHCAFDLQGRFCYVNQALAAALQRPAAEIVGKRFGELGHPPDAAAALERQIAEAICHRQCVRYEAPFTVPDGRAGHYEYLFTPLVADDGKVAAVIGSARDLDPHRKREQEWQRAHEQLEDRLRQRSVELLETNRRLQAEISERALAEKMLLESQLLLRHLAAHQEHLKENERKRIAREIHDELGQNLLALRIDVLRLQTRASRHPALNERVGLALEQLDRTIKSVRSVINNLRPAVLDLGLYAAVEWQIKDFRHRSGIACELVGDDNGFDVGLDEHRALAVFRILQESLTNIARHARATCARIELRRDAAALFMKVSDDGIGMDTGSARQVDSFGLVGIRERISALQGVLAIDSAPGRGTALAVSIPLAGDGQADD